MEKMHLYEAISSKLRDDILSGAFRPGDLMPSENELAQKYDISRGTARQSLQVLEREGMIRSAQGKGYFVCQPAHTRFVMDLRENRADLRPRYQQITVAAPDPHVREALALEDDRPVVILRKTSERDGVPVAFEEKFIPYEKGVPTVEREMQAAEFPEIFAETFGAGALRTDVEIAPSPAPDYVCRALGLPNHTVLLTLWRSIRVKDGRCVGYGRQFLTPAYGKLAARSQPYTDSDF